MIEQKDLVHLRWIYDRLKNVHKENEQYDYMIKFKGILEKYDLKKPIDCSVHTMD